jgi:hypothetical protein
MSENEKVPGYFFLNKKFLKPLTLTLSPQVGRGDKGDDYFR